MSIDYDHASNVHTLEGPRTALRSLFDGKIPASLLDVGCGTGTWLKAATELGVTDIVGVDGVSIPDKDLLFPSACFIKQDFSSEWNLGRRFDTALCLEVGEHLDSNAAKVLVSALVLHSDVVHFSAACPSQDGQHHVNCQWPGYWQAIFNSYGYVCEDAIRWKIWNDERIEWWYRQNLFTARLDSDRAGLEPRLLSVVHPQMLESANLRTGSTYFVDHVKQIENGTLPVSWYVSAPFSALARKILRRLT